MTQAQVTKVVLDSVYGEPFACVKVDVNVHEINFAGGVARDSALNVPTPVNRKWLKVSASKRNLAKIDEHVGLPFLKFHREQYNYCEFYSF